MQDRKIESSHAHIFPAGIDTYSLQGRTHRGGGGRGARPLHWDLKNTISIFKVSSVNLRDLHL